MDEYQKKLGMKEPDTHVSSYLHDVLEQAKVIYMARKQISCSLQLEMEGIKAFKIVMMNHAIA